MIKGKTIIELTDVHTGEVERHEEENMVTNALNKIFEPFGFFKSPANIVRNFFPLYEKALGGILLFDGSIEESPNAIFAPGDVRMTGCGVYNKTNDTTNTYRGNYNVTESEININNKYVKYVYDFPTSIANGTIASVCLTSDIGGYCSYGSIEKIYKKIDDHLAKDVGTNCPAYRCKSGDIEYEFLFDLDVNNDIAFLLKVDSTKQISIVKRRAYVKSISILDKINASQKGSILTTKQYDLSDWALKSTSYFNYNYDRESMILHIVSSPSNTVSTGGKITICNINLENDTVNSYELENLTETRWDFTSDAHNRSYVHAEFLYIPLRGGGMIKISLSDPSDFVNINALSTQFIGISDDERRLWMYNASYIDTETNDVFDTELTRFCSTDYLVLVGTEKQLLIANASSTLYTMMNYLATINNLSSPVTKTADKTMKVTYVIQEVSE